MSTTRRAASVRAHRAGAPPDRIAARDLDPAEERDEPPAADELAAVLGRLGPAVESFGRVMDHAVPGNRVELFRLMAREIAGWQRVGVPRWAAADVLWTMAQRHGLDRRIGADAVQSLMAVAFMQAGASARAGRC